MSNKCDNCVTNKSLCNNCSDNPKYANIPKYSLYMEYLSCCPYGFPDCVYDPEYQKKYWDNFSEKDYEQSKNYCNSIKKRFPDNCPYYDNKDK